MCYSVLLDRLLLADLLQKLYFSAEQHVFGQNAVYDCDDGYILTSKRNYRSCNENGTFSKNKITCSPRPCDSLPSIRNGSYISSVQHPVFGDKATAQCNEGSV